MPPFRKPTLVTLRRQNPQQAWGFRLGGGSDIGQPFQIQKATPDSLAWFGGLSEGDELVRIGNISLRGLTHDEVQQIIMRCTNVIDLFILTEDGREPHARIKRSEEIISEKSDVPYMDRPQHLPPMPPGGGVFKPPIYNNLPQQQQQQPPPSQLNSFHPNHMPNEDSFGVKSAPMMQQQQPPPPPPMQNGGQDFHHSPFENGPSQQESNQFKPIHSAQQTISNNANQQVKNEPIRPEAQQGVPLQKKPDFRVFGVNPRSPSKSPFKFNHSISMTPSNQTSASPAFPQQQQQQQQQIQPNRISQSTPSTPTMVKEFDFPEQHDSNNNPVRDDRKIFGLPNRIGVKPIEPMGNHGVQPVNNEKKYFGLNFRQRINSISSDRDWKEPLPIVQIPNTDLLLPSQTRKMQTYINQIPPTEKNLRPSLAGLQRRRIRPVWPPPMPRVNKGAFTEGRDSPNSQMYNWPPSRAQSVDRDFGYGEPANEESMRRVYSRVRGSTRVWPPPSNATPAGKSGYIPDENDEDNYAYNPSREPSPAPSWISSHVPITYRPPPGTQYIPQPQQQPQQPQPLINDF